jgi:phospholipid/cholesterol/gamma-HCH transport system substrate-binding protein
MTNRKIKVFGVVAVLVLAAVILVWGMTYLKDQDFQNQTHSYVVTFQDVGTLTKGDPVKTNGVKAGKVVEIAFDPNRNLVAVTLEVDSKVQIPQNSEFRLQNIGLLGERQIGIAMGQGQALANGSEVKGIYDYGISETMAVAGQVMDSAQILLTTVRSVLDSTVADPRFRQDLKDIMSNTLRLQGRIDSLYDRSAPRIDRSLKNLTLASARAEAILKENQAPIRQTISRADTLSQDALVLLRRADSLAIRLDAISQRLERNDNTVGAMLHDRALYDDLQKTLRSTDSLMNIIRAKGLDVNVDLF